jgi:hypothetical protein
MCENNRMMHSCMMCAMDGKSMTKEECDKKKAKMDADMRMAMGRPGVKESMMMKRDRRMKRTIDDRMMHSYD